MIKLRNTSSEALYITGFSEIKANGTIEVPKEEAAKLLRNPHLKEVKKSFKAMESKPESKKL